jgi:hypothetical protein
LVLFNFGDCVKTDLLTLLEVSMRDYFAAQALQALIIREGKDGSGIINEITTTAYQYADDMLNERNI